MAANILHFFAAPERIIEMHGAAAGDHENVADSMNGESFSNIISNANFHKEELSSQDSVREIASDK